MQLWVKQRFCLKWFKWSTEDHYYKEIATLIFTHPNYLINIGNQTSTRVFCFLFHLDRRRWRDNYSAYLLSV